EIVEAPIGPLGRPLTGKHARRVFFLAPIGIHTTGVGEGTWKILCPEEMQDLAPVPETGYRQLGNRLARETLRVVVTHDYTVTDLVGILRRCCRGGARRPRLQLTNTFSANVIESLIVGFAQLPSRGIRRSLGQRRLRIPIQRSGQRRIVQGLQGFIQTE